MKAKAKAAPPSAVKKVAKVAKKVGKKTSKAVERTATAVKGVGKTSSKKKAAKAKTPAKKKAAKDTGFVAAIKSAEAKMSAVAEAIVEVAQEEFEKAKRSVKKIS